MPEHVKLDDVGDSLTPDGIAAVRGLLCSAGYAHLRGVTNGFDHTAELAKLGKRVQQYNGKLIREVRPEAGIPASVISANNMSALSPHTENFEFDGPPPRIVALWCVRPAEDGGGETTLADGAAFLGTFGPPDIRNMHEREYEWRSPASLKAQGIAMSARHPILESTPDGKIMRYSSREMYPVDDAADDLHARYVQGGIKFFDNTQTAVFIDRNEVLIWDNWRIIHSRKAFTDPRRHLRRLLLNLRPGTRL